MYASFYEGKFNQIDNCASIFNTISNEPYNGYTVYNPNPPGKDKSPGINNLSGGERTIAVTALLLSMQKISNIPFIVFDEIDAYLDKHHEEILEKDNRTFSTQSNYYCYT